VHAGAPVYSIASGLGGVGARHRRALCRANRAGEEPGARRRGVPRDAAGRWSATIRPRRGRAAVGRVAETPSRPCLPRGPHRTAARRALCHGRRLSLPERDRDVRERGPGSDGERSRPRRLRLRRGAHARDARGNRRAHPVWTGGRLRRGRGRAGPVAAASRPDPPTGPRVSGQRGLAASDRAFRSNSLGCSRTEEVTIVMNEGLRLEWLVAGLLVGSIVAALVARRAVTAFWTLRAMALTPILSRRLSRWVKARSYSDEEFFRADGAAEPWVERRQSGLERVQDLGPVLGPLHPVVAENTTLLKSVSGLDEVSFHMSGTEAVMAAVRMARFNTRRKLIVCFAGAYHGWWDGVQPGLGSERSIDDCLTLKDLHEASLEAIRRRAGEIAGVLVNPVQSFHPNAPPP